MSNIPIYNINNILLNILIEINHDYLYKIMCSTFCAIQKFQLSY